jgi:very-short-patch-repair endonuclease
MRLRRELGGVKSPAETLLAVQLEQAGIPFEREYRFHPERKWRADFKVVGGWMVQNSHGEIVQLEDDACLIEVDGGSWLPKGRHTTGSGFEKDAEKLNAAAELGYRVLRYTPRMIESGEALEQIRRILSMKEQAA